MRPASCSIPSCRLAGPATCCWKTSRMEDGERVYTGKTCGLHLCAVHVRSVAGKHFCLWHSEKATAYLAEGKRA